MCKKRNRSHTQTHDKYKNNTTQHTAGTNPIFVLLLPPPPPSLWSITQTRATYGGLCGMPACGQAVGCGVCDTPELAGAAESLHTYDTYDKNTTTNDLTKNRPPHLRTIEGGAVRTTSHTRVGGRAEVSVGGRVEVRRALGRARIRRAPAGPLRTRVHICSFNDIYSRPNAGSRQNSRSKTSLTKIARISSSSEYLRGGGG